MDKLESLIMKHEGLSLRPYKDTQGLVTVGWGRCLDRKGISRDEALYLLKADIAEAKANAEKYFPWFAQLSEPRKAVVISMIFNMGLAGFSQFKRMIEAIKAGDFNEASKEMLGSLWAGQVSKRAEELANMMREDKF